MSTTDSEGSEEVAGVESVGSAIDRDGTSSSSEDPNRFARPVRSVPEASRGFHLISSYQPLSDVFIFDTINRGGGHAPERSPPHRPQPLASASPGTPTARADPVRHQLLPSGQRRDVCHRDGEEP